MTTFAQLFGATQSGVVIPFWWPSSRTINAPVTGRLILRMLGGGGGGGGQPQTASASTYASSAGGAAAWGIGVFNVVAGRPVQVIIGAGGAAGGQDAHGGNGGDSLARVNNAEVMRCPGGKGGRFAASGQAAGSGDTAAPTGAIIGYPGYGSQTVAAGADHPGAHVAFAGYNQAAENPLADTHFMLDLSSWGVDASCKILGFVNGGGDVQRGFAHHASLVGGFGLGGAPRTRSTGAKPGGMGGRGAGGGGGGRGGDGYAFGVFLMD